MLEKETNGELSALIAKHLAIPVKAKDGSTLLNAQGEAVMPLEAAVMSLISLAMRGDRKALSDILAIIGNGEKTPTTHLGKPTKQATIAALQASLCNVSEACRAVGIARSTFYKWMEEDPDFKAAVEDAREMSVDFAEGELMKRIREGDTTATIFYLKTQGRGRGYGDAIDINTDIPIKLIEDGLD